jgi:hypothetical protein
MHPEYNAHQYSPHARVDCVDCHIGPGAEHLAMSKIRGLAQVYALLTDEYASPIKTPLHQLRPAREICEQCHWPEKFFDKVMREHVYYLPDENNTRFNTALLIHVGGGGEDKAGMAGAASGIHWHMALANEVYYIATDDRKQVIPWVKMVYDGGGEAIFRADDLKESDEELLAKYTPERMDCIDCHNRSVHAFNNPQRALNSALLLGKIDVSLPFIKRKGLEVLAAEYESQAAGLAAIEATLTKYYQEEHPEVWTAKQERIAASIAAIKEIFQRNMFPEMKANWKAHPDNIGHTWSKGCFRCHDGNHRSAEGKTITKDCSVCHEIVGQGKGDSIPALTDAQGYQHPEDIDTLWQESLCTDCHTGAGADL